MKKIILLIFLICTISIFLNSADFKVDRGFKKSYSTDSLFVVQIPKLWLSDIKIVEDADLQARNILGTAVSLLHKQMKIDIDDYTLESYNNLIIEQMKANGDGKVSATNNINFNGYNAVDTELFLKIDDTELTYLVTVIEMEACFVRLTSWSISNDFSNFKDTFTKIHHSLTANKEISMYFDVEELVHKIPYMTEDFILKLSNNWEYYPTLSEDFEVKYYNENLGISLLGTVYKREDSMNRDEEIAGLVSNVEASMTNKVYDLKEINNGKFDVASFKIDISDEDGITTYNYVEVFSDSLLYETIFYGSKNYLLASQNNIEAIINSMEFAYEPYYEDYSSVWGAEKDGKMIYLAGSFHLLKENDYPLDDAFIKAYQDCEMIFFEADTDNMQTPSSQKMMAELTLLNDSKLKKEISKNLYKDLEEKLENVGYNIKQFSDKKPWFIGLFLTLDAAKKGGFDEELGVDYYIKKAAVRDSVEIQYFEDVHFQMSLFNSLNKENQEFFLKKSLEELEIVNNRLNKMAEAWKKGNSAFVAEFHDFSDIPELEEKILYERNKNWIPQIEKALENNNVIMVVAGLAHFCGEKSVLEMLEERGYEVYQFR